MGDGCPDGGLVHRRVREYFAARKLAYTEIPCPGCGARSHRPLLDFDRYLLPVVTSVCEACGLVYASKTVCGDDLERFYRNSYRALYEGATQVTPTLIFNSRARLFAMARFQAMRSVIGSFDRLMEIGSGLGFFLAECQSNGVRDVLGFELGETFRTFAQSRLGLGAAVRGERFEDVGDLPFRPSVIALFHVFEHLEYPAAALEWMHRTLDPDGWLVIEVPDILGEWASVGLMSFHIAHRTHFSAQTLCNLLAANGFTPWFVSRSDEDGIYPGNLRVFARPGEAGPAYPLPVDVAAVDTHIRSRLRLGSSRTGIPNSLMRLAAMAIKG